MNLLPSRPLQEDEYFHAESGLIHCSRCGMPRQHRFTYQNTPRLYHKMCLCQSAEYEHQECLRQREQQRIAVSRLKANSLQDPMLSAYCFDGDDGRSPLLQKAREYVSAWPEMHRKGLGLLLWGGVGTGKSFFAGCIANALLDRGVPVLMTTVPKLLNVLSNYYPGERNNFVSSLQRFPLLVIDDLGAERSSEFAQEQLFHIIDSRYRSGLPLIVTTNLELQELKTTTDPARRRIGSRILARCVPLLFEGPDLRRQEADANLSEMKALLASAGQKELPDWQQTNPPVISCAM